MAFIVIYFVSNLNLLVHSQCYHAFHIVHILVVENFVHKQGEVQSDVIVFCSTLKQIPYLVCYLQCNHIILNLKDFLSHFFYNKIYTSTHNHQILHFLKDQGTIQYMNAMHKKFDVQNIVFGNNNTHVLEYLQYFKNISQHIYYLFLFGQQLFLLFSLKHLVCIHVFEHKQ